MKDKILYVLISIVMVFFTITGTLLNIKGNIIWNFGTLATILALSLALGVLIGAFVGFMIPFVDSKINVINGKLRLDDKKLKPVLKSPTFIGFVAFAFILLCMVPGYLAYFPGICSYDAGVQAVQIFSGDYYEHHPVIHTLMIEGCLRLGYSLFHEYNAGIAIYSGLQMLLYSVVAGFSVAVIFRITSKKNLMFAYIFAGLLTLYSGLFDFNRFMAITVTKDSVFSIFFLLQFILFICIINTKPMRTKQIVFEVLFGFSMVMCILLRNNSKYAFLVTFVLELLFVLVKWSKFYIKVKAGKLVEKPIFESLLPIITIVAIIAGSFILVVVGKALNATQGDRREMLSVPIEQMGRCAVYHSGYMVVPEDDGTLSDETMALINEFMLYESFTLYEPDIADPIKRHTNTSVARYKTKEFLTAYLTMLRDHPGDYLNAFIALENGFINVLDESHATVNQKEGNFGLGYVQTRWDDYLYSVGLYKDSKLPGLFNFLENWAENNTYLKYPILKHVYMPGLYLYIFLYAFATVLNSDKKKMLFILTFCILYFGTMLLGPTVQERYVYPFMLVCPFMILSIIYGKGREELE